MNIVRFFVALVLLCNVARASENFVGADDIYLDCAEQARDDIARFWLGKELPNWSNPCKVKVKLYKDNKKNSSGGGSTTFHFDNGEVYGWGMYCEGSHIRLMDSVIPHEVHHTIIASMTRRRVPRWLDEGLASLFEHHTTHLQWRQMARQYADHEWSAFNKFSYTGNYPENNMEGVCAMYATGFSVVEWLLEIGGREKLRAFLTAGGRWEDDFYNVYNYRPHEAEVAWKRWLKDRPLKCTDCNCYVHGRKYTYETAKFPTVPDGRPILYCIGTDTCYACRAFINAYALLPGFREALQRRAVVVKVDGHAYSKWVVDKGIQRFPAFILQVGGKEYKLRGYPGRRQLVSWMDNTLATHTATDDGATMVIDTPETDLGEPAPLQQTYDEPKEQPKPKDEPPTQQGLSDAERQKYEDRLRELEQRQQQQAQQQAQQNQPKDSTPVDKSTKVEQDGDEDDGVLLEVPFFGPVTWKGLGLTALGLLGIGIPGWAVWAYRAAGTVGRLRDKLAAAHSGDGAETPRQTPTRTPPQHYQGPVSPNPQTPTQVPTTNPPDRRPIEEAYPYRDCKKDDVFQNDISDNVNRYPGARHRQSTTREHHYVTDSPPVERHRVDTQFVNVPDDAYALAHEEARKHVARRYPGSQEILEAEKSLINQFMAGQPPANY